MQRSHYKGLDRVRAQHIMETIEQFVSYPWIIINSS